MLGTPSSTKDTRHRRLDQSRHPRRTISPLYSVMTPVFVKMTSQPASHNSLTAMRLLWILSIRKDCLAFGGSLDNNNSNVFDVRMAAPFGIVKFLLGSCTSSILAGTLLCKRDDDAVESSKAMRSKFSGFGQPEYIWYK